MKTIKKQFQKFTVLLILIFSLNSVAQKEGNERGVFLRIYNMEGKKINKGYFKFTNDNVLGIIQKRKLVQLNVEEIRHIKTKRSAGHNALVGSALGLGTGMLIGAATSDQETKTADGGFLFGTYEYKTGHSPGTAAAVGGLIGIAGGGIVGLTGSLIKKSNTYIIDGKIENLERFANNISLK